MAISPKLLNEEERVVVSTRTHAKALLLPVLVLLVTAFLAAYVAASVDDWTDSDTARSSVEVITAGVAVIVVLWWVVRPFLGWFSTSYTFTDRRFIHRTGILRKEGRTIPLNRISGVDFDMGIVDRIFGCGTLVVSDASEQGRVELHDIPQVERVQMQVAEELHRQGQREHSTDDGT